MGPLFTKWTPSCVEEDLKLVIMNVNLWEKSLLKNKSINQVGSFFHYSQYKYTSFCIQWSCPLLTIRKNAGLGPFWIGFISKLCTVSELTLLYCTAHLRQSTHLHSGLRCASNGMQLPLMLVLLLLWHWKKGSIASLLFCPSSYTLP